MSADVSTPAKAIARPGGLVRLAKKVIRKPGYAVKALGRTLASRQFPAPEGRDFIAERIGVVSGVFTQVSGQTRGKGFGHGAILAPHAELLWSLVRDRKPARVVETGVCNGLSSAVILAAMDRNGFGELISVDLPEFTDPALNTEAFWEGKGGAVVPAGREVGWLVPAELRGRWTLQLGRSSVLLPAALAGGCDIFIHDSEHSYENQMFEFRLGWDALRPGGVLVATDINWSNAFDDFCRQVRPRRQFVDHSCCLMFKR